MVTWLYDSANSVRSLPGGVDGRVVELEHGLVVVGYVRLLDHLHGRGMLGVGKREENAAKMYQKLRYYTVYLFKFGLASKHTLCSLQRPCRKCREQT